MVIFGYGNKFSGLSRAIIALLAGLVLIIWPGMATTIMVQAVAVFFIIRAIMAIFFGGKDGKTFMNYFIEVLFAIVLLMGADVIAGFIIYIVAFLLILLGLYQVFILLASRNAFRNGGLLSFLPVLVIICAFLLLFAGGKNWVSYLAGATLILYGISDLISLWTVEHYASKIFQGFEGFGGRHGRRARRAHFEEAEEQGSEAGEESPMDGIDYDNVKDVDYEKVDEQ